MVFSSFLFVVLMIVLYQNLYMSHFDTFNTPTKRLYNYFSVLIFLPFPEQPCANHPIIFRIGVMQISSLLMEADIPCRWHKKNGCVPGCGAKRRERRSPPTAE
jgi:hypothetical protein